jgi:uncharacterized protein (DUF488 family)
MSHVLYTLGYERRTLDEFIGLLRAAKIDLLVDVRETAWSHKPGFSKGALSEALESAGISYVHASFAGNPKWLRAQASSHRECLDWYSWYIDEHSEVVEGLERLLTSLHGKARRVCLTCFERHSDDCHRGILADRWRTRGRRTVRHLHTSGCKRLAVT